MAFYKLNHLRLLTLSIVLAAAPACAQQGASNSEWRYYGGDSGTTKYSPLDQINVTNAKNLRIAWQWHSENFGRRLESNREVTPFMVDGVLYFTTGSRRDAVAVDAANGETLWMYQLDKGARRNQLARTNNRGIAYRSDGKGDNRKYTGNTGAWVPLSADNELGYVDIPFEMPTGDFYGGTPGR